MEEWRFVFEDNTSQDNGITSGIENTIGSGTSQKANKKSNKKDDIQRITGKLEENILQQTIISPLNTATGGLTSPIYNVAKRVVSGASSAGIATAAITAVIQLTKVFVDTFEKKMQVLRQQATQLNNNDNALIRAGRVSQATYYSADISGIKKTTNRS